MFKKVLVKYTNLYFPFCFSDEKVLAYLYDFFYFYFIIGVDSFPHQIL